MVKAGRGIVLLNYRVTGGGLMSQPPYLLIRASQLADDPRFSHNGGDGRRITVAKIRSEFEHEASTHIWFPNDVLEKSNYSLVFFSQDARQHRHQHHFTEEIFIVLQGRMFVCFERGESCQVNAGDALIVQPNCVHHVLRTSEFTAALIAIGPQVGPADIFVQLEAGGEWRAWDGLTFEQRRHVYNGA